MTDNNPPPREWTDALQEDWERILTVGEECISAEELKKLLLTKGRRSEQDVADGNTNVNINLYDGFEPSGRMHIAQGVFKAMNVNKCTSEGTNATFIFWVADWFALMNDKMGGDLEKIKTVGHYLIEVWKAAGMNLDSVIFKWASEEITTQAHVYWPTMLDVAKRFNLTRIKKCCQIMGRLEGSLTAAQILYPLMQCTDVFFLKADICQLGVDQRKVNMLAREYCDVSKYRKNNKPIILSHHMLFGLKKGQEKMSKSDPDSAVFMEDSAEDVARKIQNAYCPTKEEEEEEARASADGTTEQDAGKESMHLVKDKLKNPCLDYIHHIIFSPPNATFTAGGTTYQDFGLVREAFLSGTISEEQLKEGLINALNTLLEPVRTHFTTNERAKELLSLVQQYKREGKTAVRAEKTIRRLDLVSLGKLDSTANQNRHVVFAPLPNAAPTLQEAIDTLRLLKHKDESSGTKSEGEDATGEIILYLSDWSARVCNACGGGDNTKAIAAYYQVFLTCLKQLDTAFMETKVKVLYQSEMILLDPSNYWISVINVGRHFSLKDVMGQYTKDSDSAGWVVSRLMQVADAAALTPTTVAMLDTSPTTTATAAAPAAAAPGAAGEADAVTAALEAVSIADVPVSFNDSTVVPSMITEFFVEKLSTLSVPTIQTIQTPSLVLQQRESIAHKMDTDEYYLLDKSAEHGKSKMKKAFCEPKNVSFCPPITMIATFTFDFNNDNAADDNKSLTIQRSEQNGGDITFHSLQELQTAFESEALHPSDLKPIVCTKMVQILQSFEGAIKADKDVTKAAKTLQALKKKLAKSGKK